jgi:drug/metabolite transporter (DMT)-like permease
MGGKASVIAPLGSLYPLVSIPLAIYYWHERVTGREAAGIVCALLSVVLLAWETNGSSVPSGAAADG